MSTDKPTPESDAEKSRINLDRTISLQEAYPLMTKFARNLERQRAEARQNERAAQKGAERNAIVNRGLAESNAQLRAELTALREVNESTRRILADGTAVHINMLRGTIAKPTVEQMLHVIGNQRLSEAWNVLKRAEHTPAEETKPL